MMQIRRNRCAPFLTSNPMARVTSPMGTFTTQHSTTPREFMPDQSPHFGGKAVDHTINAPQTTAGLPNTSATIWKKIAEPFFPVGGIGACPELPTFPILGNPSLATEVIHHAIPRKAVALILEFPVDFLVVGVYTRIIPAGSS